MDRQPDLFGNIATGTEKTDKEEIGTAKSALQKYIRRGEVEKAMYWANWLSMKGRGFILWRRLVTIAVEDVLDPVVLLAVEVLSKIAGREKYDTWDGRRAAVAAAKLLAEAPKNRSCDEFLEMIELMDKYEEDPEVKAKNDELSSLDDYVFDMHTAEGRRRNRRDKHWYEEASMVMNPSDRYRRYNEWVWKVKQRLQQQEGKRLEVL